MGSRRKLLLFLLVCCVFASFVSAQSISVTFLDEWGEPTSRVLEQGKALLRVIDPGADVSPGPDTVAVDLTSTIMMDSSFTDLVETGDATGVFEGEVDLTTDFYLNYLEDADHLLTQPRTYPPLSLDTANATYNGVTGSAEAAPSLTDLLQADGDRSPASFALGERVRVRVRDRYADRASGPDRTTANLSTSGGDDELLTLIETGGRSADFEAILPLVPGAPQPGDGKIQAGLGETLSVTHADANGFSSSSDSATVGASSVQFIDRLEGRPTDVYLEGSSVLARVVDLAANADPNAFDSVTVGLSMQLSGDVETLALRETGPATGVFEGKMYMGVGYQYSGSLVLESQPVTSPPQFDTATVTYGSLTDSATLTGSTLHLLDESGTEGASFALGSDLRMRVETAYQESEGNLDSTDVEVRSLTTGDLETVRLWETGLSNGVFEAKLPILQGPAAFGDGRLQAAPGETLRVEHPDMNGVTRSSAEAAVVRSSVRFVDGDGRPTSVLLEEATAQVEVLDAPSAGQSPPAAVVESYLGQDSESLSLAETAGSPGLFAGSIPLVDGYRSPGNGLLEVSRGTFPVNHPDTVTAESNGASASAITVPILLEFVDDQGEPIDSAPAGATVRVRAVSPRANTSPSAPDIFYPLLRSFQGGDMEYVTLVETGPNTSIFTGTVPSRRTTEPGDPNGLLTVRARDTVEMSYDPPNYPYPTDADQVADHLIIVPVQVELLNDQGQRVSTYLYGETVHLRVSDADANTDAFTAETVTVDVQTWRRSDNRPDLETVSLTETGTDTGVFTGSLSTFVIGYSATPTLHNGLLEHPDIAPPYGDETTLTATRGEVSASAVLQDSQVSLTDAAGQDTDFFPIGSSVYVKLRRPRANTTPGVDTDTVELWTHLYYAVDLEPLTLTETGGDTGVFTGSIPTGPDPFTPSNGILEGTPGLLFEVDKDATFSRRAFDLATLVAPGNSAPVAQDDATSTIEDTPVTILVRSNDSDPDNDPLTITAVTQGANGSVAIDPSGTVTYTPGANWSGSDAFTYTVTDSYGLTDSAAVTVTVYPVNDPPDAVDDSATTSEDTPVTIAVKANDTDPEGNALVVSAVPVTAHGTLVINANGTITYTSNANFHGTDTFVYFVNDSETTYLYDQATVTVTVTPVNDPPDAVNDTATVNEDAAISVPVLVNDTDPEGATLQVTAVTQGAHGTVSIMDGGRQVAYWPAADYSGTDSFTYTISDGDGGTDTATVDVTVTPVNDPPDAVNDAATTAEDTAVTVAVKTNDTDPDGDALTVTSVTQGSKGSSSINAGGTVTYTPNANANGSDSFTYTISDGHGGSDTATVNVTITAVNDAPNAVNDTAATNEDTPVTIAVLANDSDIDGGALSVSAVTQGTKGVVTRNGTTVTYTPSANTNGVDSFTYTVSDGNGGTATATVTVSVAAVNDAPITAPDSGATRENVPVIVAVLANDTDVEGNPLTVTFTSTPPNGSTSRLPDNTVRYWPHPNFTGMETFTYTVSDGQGGTSTGQVTVVVGEALERVAVLATNSVALRTGSDVLSGDVIANRAGTGPFLNGAELSVGGSVTTAASWDVEGDSVTVAAGAVVSSDVRYNQLTNNGTISGLQSSPLALPVFSALPSFPTATPGSTNVNVANNGTLTLAAGSYLDLVVGRKGTVTFTGGIYHFRSIQVDREAKLYFSAASEVRVQQKLSTKTLTLVKPAVGATIDASSIVFYVGGINGTSGALTATPKAVEIGTDNTVSANLYAPNGTIWLQDRALATGAFLGKDVDVGADVQVNLDSAFSGGQ
jgi:hypothetical protein